MKKLVVGLLVLVFFHGLGELGVKWLGLEVPGQLLGMILLLVVLSVNNPLLMWLESASSQLIRYIGLLFVPVTTGAFFLSPEVGAQFPQIAAVLIGSTVVAQWFMGLLIGAVSKPNE